MRRPDTRSEQDTLHTILDTMVKTTAESDNHPERVVADLERQLLFLIALTGDDDDLSPKYPAEQS